jgi:hypothetical protein
MLATTDHLLTFWMTPWSAPLRSACIWIDRFGPPISGKKPDSVAPNWVRPLFLQRWVAQAISARLVWLEAHPDLAADRHGHESTPCWEEVAWASYDRRCLRELAEATLLRIFGMEVERLLRIVQEPPGLVGAWEWTLASLGASEHLAQLYAELKRRHRAARARAILREELRRFITWHPAAVAD